MESGLPNTLSRCACQKTLTTVDCSVNCSVDGMDRRRCLTAIGTAGASLIAGCSGGDGSSGGGNGGSGGNSTTGSGGGTTTAGSTTGSKTTQGSETTQQTSDSTTTGTETSSNGDAASALEISGTELEEGEFDIGVVGEIENTGDQRLAYVEATATFRNDAGDVLDTTMTNLAGLESGQIWETYVPYLGDKSEVAEGELSISDAVAGEIPEPPDAVELLEDSLEPPADDFSGPKVTGRAENTGDSTIGYLEAAATFVAENGNVLGSGFTNVTDLPAGETWSFEIEFTSYSTEVSDDVSDYELYLTDSPF